MDKSQEINKKAAMEFVEAINNHDVTQIIEQMSMDHVFIDVYGSSESRTEMSLGWPGYFQWFPDYRIEIAQILATEDTVALFGYASGTYHGEKNHWRHPAAWQVELEGGKVKTWQVYADSKIPYACMH